ncbi:catechol 2,3-dioxygenase-like lactoylglutathione lyase family enzyme [Actinoplanes octamycinicus]|uniref:Catechol 2,3-dioxygenase-like lactoylglutathione lyase family enzyme n=1 Tax=Actinoplanes octamycinicus TaxID=135948 RepID=A0A7W7H1J4_9ACTN|nr:VOC family protein [Actinoplanes octamycinicus]MBB4742296.1 catechol 2,3-dioxygenase-like lactoylglutathione lyase family enzyme [Actinoplanes octamycinicus]GIE59859.1 hypothetical protein Aoc01nite_52610 [Actinoplanes octamycinicus]
MTGRRLEIRFEVGRPAGAARFWAGLLGRETVEEAGGVLVPGGDTQAGLRFVPGGEPRVGPDRLHLHLTSATVAEQRETVAAALRLGGRHLDVGQLPEEEHVVLADPAGNEFCVIEPGNTFLAGCGRLGEVTCDGSRAAGLFWSAALGWPLVWDQDQETAIQSPHGGTKISWSGTPGGPGSRRSLDLVPGVHDHRPAEVERLVSLGATTLGDTDGAVLLADPDGAEFRLLTRRS